MDRFDPDLLLANAGWVRALARELAGPGGADDLVQETWLAALRRAGNERNLSAWLAGVVRHLAGRARRGEESRARRERERAPGDDEPAVDELVAEAEIQRRVTAAVIALDEPYRSTVLLRYFRGASLAEIARLQGVPAATARTRLHRALERLRQALDRCCGDRQAWSAAALSLARATGPGEAVAGSGALLRGAMGKLGLVAALSCVVTAVVLWRQPAATRQQLEVTTASNAAVQTQVVVAPERDSVEGALVAPVAAGAERSRDPVPSAEPSTTPGARAYGSLLDARSQFVEEGWVTVEDGAGLELGGPMKVEGSWSIDGLHPGRWTLRAGGRNLWPTREDLFVATDDRIVARDLELASQDTLRIRMIDQAGEPILPGQTGIVVLATEEPLPEDVLGLPPSLEAFESGRFTFAGTDGRLPEGCFGTLELEAFPALVSAVFGAAILETRTVTAPIEELVFRVDLRDVEDRRGGLRARFVDALSGEPVTRGMGQLLSWNAISLDGTPLDDLGRAVFEGRPPGPRWLSLLDQDHASIRHAVRILPGSVEDAGDVPVWPRATLRGEIVDEEGAPCGAYLRWAVASEIHGPQDVLLPVLRRIGHRFELHDVARAPLWLVLTSSSHAPAGLVVDASSGNADGIVVRLHRGVPVSFRHDRDSFGGQLTVASEDGLPIATWNLGERQISTHLAPGRYQLWTGVGQRVERREELVVGDGPLEIRVPPPAEPAPR